MSDATDQDRERGAKLQAARRKARLTQKQAASAAGLKSHSTLSQYESGDRRPPAAMLETLAALYGVPASDFMLDGTSPAVPVDSSVRPGGVVSGVGARRSAVQGAPQFRRGEAPRWPTEDVEGAGPNWYATQYELDTVRVVYGEGPDQVVAELQPGDVLVMADDVTPRHGDIVHAHTDRGERSELRLYIEADGVPFLVPLFSTQTLVKLAPPWAVGSVVAELRRKRR